jgi:hypothetical protein
MMTPTVKAMAMAKRMGLDITEEEIKAIQEKHCARLMRGDTPEEIAAEHRIRLNTISHAEAMAIQGITNGV